VSGHAWVVLAALVGLSSGLLLGWVAAMFWFDVRVVNPDSEPWYRPRHAEEPPRG
jgi:hypothetical protein